MRKTLIVVGMLFFSNVSMAGGYLGITAGPSYGSIDAPATLYTPTLHTTSSEYGFLTGLVAGYRADPWSLNFTYATIGAQKAISSGTICNSDRIDSHVKRDVDDSMLSVTVGRSFKLDNYVNVEANVGAVYWKRDTTDSNTLTTYKGCSGPVRNIQQSTSSVDDSAVSGTAGVALVWKSGPVNFRFSVQYYGGIDATSNQIGVDYSF